MYAPQETEHGQTIYYEYMSEEGIPYYFNPKTSTAQWERPTDAVVQPPPLFDGSLPTENTGRVNASAGVAQTQMGNPQMDPYSMMQGYGMMAQYGVMGHPQYMAAMDPAMMQNQIRFRAAHTHDAKCVSSLAAINCSQSGIYMLNGKYIEQNHQVVEQHRSWLGLKRILLMVLCTSTTLVTYLPIFPTGNATLFALACLGVYFLVGFTITFGFTKISKILGLQLPGDIGGDGSENDTELRASRKDTFELGGYDPNKTV